MKPLLLPLAVVVIGLLPRPLRAQTPAPAPGVPPITTADPFSVQTAIRAAAKRGDTHLTIPPGIYRFPRRPDGGRALDFYDLHDFVIDAPGVTMIFTDTSHPSLRLEHCENVTLRGLTLINDPVAFSQARIEAIAPDRKSFDMRVAKGYPEYLDRQTVPLYFFDPKTRQWKAGSCDVYCDHFERLEPGLFRMHQSIEDQPIVVGDLVAWRGPTMPDIELSGSTRCRVEDVVIRSGKGFCVYEGGGEGDNYYRYKVTYGPTPSGADEPPLMGANADAFHSSAVRHGPTLERCLFEGMGDDGVPIHGAYALVTEAAGPKVTICARSGEFCRVGDPLQFMDERQAKASEAKVTAVQPLPGYHPPEGFVFPKDLHTFQTHHDDDKYFQVTLDRDANAPAGVLVGNPAACGGNFVVRDCTIRNHRARGMLIKAGPGLIEGCLVDGSTIADIVIAPELGYWNESSYSHDIVLRHNTIRHSSIWKQPWLDMAGALCIAAFERNAYVPLPGGHRNILVENNLFEDNDGPNVLVSSAVGVTLRGNEFRRPMENASDRGHGRGVDDEALIWLTQCRDVRLENNRVVEPGTFLKQLVSATATASGTGFADGVK